MRPMPIFMPVALLSLAACSSTKQPPSPMASTRGSTPIAAEKRPASGPADGEQALDWSRLEVAVTEAAKDKKIKIPPGKTRHAAMAYAREINRIPVEEMRQYHLDRASIVLEREVFSGVTLAEGAALRGRVSGGGGGSTGGTRATRDRNSRTRSTGSSSSGTSTTGSNRNVNPF